MGKRLQNINLENTDANRQKYRQLLFTAEEDISSCISGVILFDETFRQSTSDGKPFVDVCHVDIENLVNPLWVSKILFCYVLIKINISQG